jgi:hypothetical protein
MIVKKMVKKKVSKKKGIDNKNLILGVVVILLLIGVFWYFNNQGVYFQPGMENMNGDDGMGDMDEQAKKLTRKEIKAIEEQEAADQRAAEERDKQASGYYLPHYLTTDGFDYRAPGCGYRFKDKETCEGFKAAYETGQDLEDVDDLTNDEKEQAEKFAKFAPEIVEPEGCIGRIPEVMGGGEYTEIDISKVTEEPGINPDIEMKYNSWKCMMVGLKTPVGIISRGKNCQEHCENEIGRCIEVEEFCQYYKESHTRGGGPISIYLSKSSSAYCDCNPPHQ